MDDKSKKKLYDIHGKVSGMDEQIKNLDKKVDKAFNQIQDNQKNISDLRTRFKTYYGFAVGGIAVISFTIQVAIQGL